jgi:putative tryptophan/tyrosine transport system substrate-binding protein
MKFLLVILFSWSLCLTPASAASNQQALERVSNWFNVLDDVLQSWNMHIPEGHRDQRVVAVRADPVEGPEYKVMVIYPRKSSAYDLAISTMLEHFHRNLVNVEFVIANFEQDPVKGAALVHEAHRDHYALIYAMGSETVDWLHSAHRDIQTPVVTVCAKDPVQLNQMPDYEIGSGTNFAFTSLNLRLDVQLEYLRELKPNLKNIGIMVDMNNSSALETQAKPLEDAARGLGIHAFNVAVTDPRLARQQLQTLLPAAIEEMRQTDPDLQDSIFWITGSTSVFAEIETISELNQSVPVLAAVPEVVQSGSASAVLSIGISFQSNAQLAAVYGSEILNGNASPGELKVGIVSPPDIAINFLRARDDGLKIPFSFFEAASFVFDAQGRPVRVGGRNVQDP